MSPDGAKVWFIPDGYLATPVDNDPSYKNHEAFCVMNTTEQHAHLLIDFYFADRDPVEGVSVTVPAKRCLHLRTDITEHLGGYALPFDTPYGARIRSDVPIIVQYSRMYSTTRNISLMTTMAYPLADTGE